MRKKKNLGPRMERCEAWFIPDPAALRGKWRSELGVGERLLALELGCGKGTFSVKTAAESPDLYLLALDKVDDALVVGLELAADTGAERLKFISADAEALPELFENGEIDRIYINFCDPWPSNKHAKRRITHHDFLRSYAALLADGGEVWFKTDNVPLFLFSLRQFTNAGWDVLCTTRDLHAAGWPNVMTDYEAKFSAEGIKINALKARKPKA